MKRKLSRAASVESTVLPNGLKIMTEHMPTARSVSLGIWLRSGSRHETAAENGISHFIEHMVFKATKTREAEDIARALDEIGGHMDAYTSRELVCYNAKVLDEHLPQALDVLADLARNPLFREDDIAKEKSVVLEEMKMDEDSPEYQTHDIFCRNFWKDNSLGRPILGVPWTVRSFDSSTLKKYFKRYYSAPNILVTAAGQVKHAKFVKLVESYFGALPKRKPVPSLPTAATFARISARNKPSLEQVQMCLGAPACSISNPERYSGFVLNTILGGGMSSRLFQNIRERQGLVYNISTDLTLYRDTGCFGVYAGTSPDKLRQVVTSTMEEIRRIKQDRVEDSELVRAKANLKGSIVLGLESSSSRMSNLARQDIFFGSFTDVDEAIARVEAVTADEVRDFADRYLRGSDLALTVLGPLAGVKFTRKDLAC